MLGEFVVLHDGQNVNLPTSRKTRALLAYLAVNGPQQREHLCEMFWDVAQNPRRALRWSLWQIRKLVNIKRYCALVSEDSTVLLRSRFVAVDFLRIKGSMRDLASLEAVNEDDRPGSAGMHPCEMTDIHKILYSPYRATSRALRRAPWVESQN